MSLVTDVYLCPWSVTCSSSHLTQKFPICCGWKTSANEWHSKSTSSLLPSSIFGLPVCFHSWTKLPIIFLLWKWTEFQVSPAAWLRTQLAESTLSIMQVKIDMNKGTDLDSSPSINQKRHMEIRQVLFWPPQLYLTCLFTETVFIP